MTSDQFKILASKNRKIMGCAGTEHALQVECVKWFRLQYPNLIIYAIPNGGYRSNTTAIQMKMEGQLSGIPDLCIPVPNKEYHGLYIEMKNGKKGVLSDNQKEMICKLSSFGYKVDVCRSFDEFEKSVKGFFVNT